MIAQTYLNNFAFKWAVFWHLVEAIGKTSARINKYRFNWVDSHLNMEITKMQVFKHV